MVLESLVNPPKMERHPTTMFLLGLFYSTLGLLFSFIFFIETKDFSNIASIAAVFITTIPLVVVMMNTVKYEEEKDLCIHKERFLIKEHGKALTMFLFLFLGMVVSYSFWFTILPDGYTHLFSYQIKIIKLIQGDVGRTVGNVIQDSGKADLLGRILVNNLSVLAACILLSFLYGAGAVFILTLNASVIGVAVGVQVRETLTKMPFLNHYEFIINYFNSSVSLTFCYMVHGVFEISAYIVGALAGGIISVAVMNRKICRGGFWHIVADSSDLILLSILLVVFAGFIEVFVTPSIC